MIPSQNIEQPTHRLNVEEELVLLGVRAESLDAAAQLLLWWMDRAVHASNLLCNKACNVWFSTGWLDWMSHRKQKNGQNQLHWPVLPILPIFLFPVRHPGHSGAEHFVDVKHSAQRICMPSEFFSLCCSVTCQKSSWASLLLIPVLQWLLWECQRKLNVNVFLRHLPKSDATLT